MTRWWHRLATGHWPLWLHLYLGLTFDVPLDVCRRCMVDAAQADARHIGGGAW